MGRTVCTVQFKHSDFSDKNMLSFINGKEKKKPTSERGNRSINFSMRKVL